MTCHEPIDVETLVAWWLGEVPAEPEDLLALLLRDSLSAWWDDRATPAVEHRDDILAACLDAAYAQMVRVHGAPGSDGWRWDHVQRVNVRHLLRIPALSALFERVKALGAEHVRFNIETKIDPNHPEEYPDPQRFVTLLLGLFIAQIGLGNPAAGTYDERGLLGFAADPGFSQNGRFWVWYTNINEHTASQPNFFQWLVSTSDPWNMTQYNHVGYLEEYQVVGGIPAFRRTLLKIKRPYFNHTGFQSLLPAYLAGTGYYPSGLPLLREARSSPSMDGHASSAARASAVGSAPAPITPFTTPAVLR